MASGTEMANYNARQMGQINSNNAEMSEYSTNMYAYGVPYNPAKQDQQYGNLTNPDGTPVTYGQQFGAYNPSAQTALKQDMIINSQYLPAENAAKHSANMAIYANTAGALAAATANEAAQAGMYTAQAGNYSANAELTMVQTKTAEYQNMVLEGTWKGSVEATNAQNAALSQYADPMAATALAQNQANVAQTQTQTGLTGAQIGQTYASTGLTGAQAQQVGVLTEQQKIDLQKQQLLFGSDVAYQQQKFGLDAAQQQAQIGLLNAQAAAALRPQQFAPPSPKEVAEAKIINATAGTNINMQNAQNKMITNLTPAQEASQKAAYELAKAKSEQGIQLMPEETAALSSQYALAKQKADMEMEINPARYGLEGEQIASARELLPGETAASKAETSNRLLTAEKRAPIISKFYEQALAGVDPTKRANQAQADIEHSFGMMDQQLRENASRTGIDPSSPAYQAQVAKLQLEKAKGIAGARTQATGTAEDESWRRLSEGMGIGG